MIAVDTNIFVGATQTFDPALRATSRRAVKSLYAQGEELLCFPQNLVEFWSAATRPANVNGLGLSAEQAARYVDRFQILVRLLQDSPAIFPAWRKLVLEHRISGIQVHDARIVAAMNVHQVSRLLTFDLHDFRRYAHITVVNPDSL